MRVIDEHCQKDRLNDIRQNANGISVYETAEALQFLQNNVNADVNKLFQEGKVIRICGDKIYRFYSQQHFSKTTGEHLRPQTACNYLQELLEDMQGSSDQDDPSTQLTGFDGSPRSATLSAKAGILYPGGALHTLLLGESGVGKSLLIEKIFMYDKKHGIFNKDGQFVVFNCTDYANNAKLLLSHLFGSVKGTYTGVDSTREGLLKRSDGGMLFLDEVHRPPPEGQEMLFHFIDKKKYYMFGEANCEYSANVALVVVTIENLDNHLLTTPLRRIPMVTKIPSLKEKSLRKREQMTLYLYTLKAAVICSDTIIDKDTMTVLILYHPKGNIGQLKNDIKLSIARNYLEMRNNKESELHIRKYTFLHQVSDGLIDQDIEQRKEIEKMLARDTYTVTPFRAGSTVIPTSMFEFLVSDTTQSDIQTSSEEYVDKIAVSLEQDSPPFFIIDNEIREIMTFIHEWTLQNMQILIGRRQSIALAFYLEDIRDCQTNAYLHNEYTLECEIAYIEKARSLIRSIEQRFNLRIISEGVHTLACILKTFKSNSSEICSISMFVVVHGNSLATNIADVVNKLFSIDYVIAQDMPLMKNVNQTIEESIEEICKEPL